MSFDANVLSSKPVIRAAANMQNDGGGGNLGYMSQGRKGQGEKKEEINIFAQKPAVDTFTISGKLELPEDDDFSLTKWFSDIVRAIRNYLAI